MQLRGTSQVTPPAHPLHVGAELSQDRPINVEIGIDNERRSRRAGVFAPRFEEEKQNQRTVEDGPGRGNAAVDH